MNEFSEAFVAAYDRMPQWWQDQFQASMRETAVMLDRLSEFVERYKAAGVDAAEKFANGEAP